MQIFVKYYDKLFVIFVLTALSLVFGLQLNDEVGFSSEYLPEEYPSWERSSEGVTLQSKLQNDLMPGSFIFYKNSDNNYSKIEISKLIFKRRAEVSVELLSGKKILNGRVKAKEGVIISKNLEKFQYAYFIRY